MFLGVGGGGGGCTGVYRGHGLYVSGRDAFLMRVGSLVSISFVKK